MSGGLVGAALATRLSEDPSVNVTIIEAGGENFHDETIDVPSKVYQNFGNPNFDWAFMSTPQPKLNGRPVFLPKYSYLTSSTCLFLTVPAVARVWEARVYAPSEEYNDIARLAGEGWSWDELQPYFRKSETLIRNEEDAKKYGAKYLGHYGTSGPVKRSLPHSINAGALAWVEAFKARGIQHNADNAYYEPNKTRPNLNVILNAHATRILTSVDGLVTATGVEYLKGDSVHVLHANKEVIVSCGAFKTPQLLELSGLGHQYPQLYSL
ncbi:hypothetical protein H0H93_014882 [Arthromyces matolae]|nr:hypothetical protein H0H93_014882 [Arthromyces matolae]